jgi:N-acylneuraminate cytidylyltransferase/CMP-N,N'-diacetyllegionaminic acid synthase
MIVIIPARGGSKGLPGKNLKVLSEKPLIAHSIETALKCPELTRVIVSTDDNEIASVSKEYGAEVPFMRPSTLATDDAKAIDTYKYTINQIIQNEGVKIEDFMVLLPTSPLRIVDDISSSLNIFRNNGADSVISVSKQEKPISWFKTLDAEGKILENNIALRNRQDEEDYYCPNGSIYIFRKELIDAGKYYSNKTYAYIMPQSRSVDIDTQNDLDYVTYLYKRL